MGEQGITVKKSENFSEWYIQVVQKAGLADYGPVQGSIAFKPYAYAIWEKIQNIFDKKIKATGHKNAYFPLMIPERLLKKEAEHFEGFVPEVFWITHSGENKLGERLAIRPTSETIIYYFMSKWIRSWRDLPLLLNQWCNVARAEIKSTKPFIRTTEFLWQEGHTAHATFEDAEKEVMMILEFYRDLMENYLAIPVLVGKKSDNEKFAGAFYTTTLEALMPDGRALQCGTSHHLSQNFSKPFEIKFLDKDGKTKYVYTTSWGVTTRLIGALVMVHGDDKGLILPPRVAPIQIVIVPIYYSEGEKEKVLKISRKLRLKLESAGFSVHLDDREEYTPGWKFNEWELKGVPIRIEIGPRDVKNKTITIVRRDSGRKSVVKQSLIIKEVISSLDDIQQNLFKKAKDFLEKNIRTVRTYNRFKVFAKRGGFVKAMWCGDSRCELKIKEETGMTIRTIPFDEKAGGKCVYCGRKAKHVAYFARAY